MYFNLESFLQGPQGTRGGYGLEGPCGPDVSNQLFFYNYCMTDSPPNEYCSVCLVNMSLALFCAATLIINHLIETETTDVCAETKCVIN